jgi:hypothetical protein
VPGPFVYLATLLDKHVTQLSDALGMS